LQGDLYSTITNYITYREDKQGLSASFGRWFSEYASGNLSLVYESLRISDPTTDAPQFILDQVGTQSTSGFRSVVSRDTRDFYLDPRTGTRLSAGIDYGTPALGGTNNFYKTSFDALKYQPLFWDTRVMVRGRYGQVEGLGGKPVPITERYFVGGINTMRGFVFGRAGPVTQSGSLVGATQQIIFNTDFIFPISAEAKLNGVLFFDYGQGIGENENVNFLKLRQAAGVEARWISPFGPLRLAYGFNLDPNPGERKAVFEFSVGSLF
jgi:outer membrane protein insertion porin family